MKKWISLCGITLGILSYSDLAQASPVLDSPAVTLSQTLEAILGEQNTPPAGIQFETYTNDLFGYRVDVPKNLFLPMAPIFNKEGQRFLSASGDIEMMVYGQNRVDRTLQGLYDNTLYVYEQLGVELAYAELLDDQYVISGYDPKGFILYTKVILDEDDLITLSLVYDTSLQAELEPVFDYVADSLQVN